MIVIDKDALHAAVSTLNVYLDLESDPMRVTDKVQDYLTTHAVQDYFHIGEVDPYLFIPDITALASEKEGINELYADDDHVRLKHDNLIVRSAYEAIMMISQEAVSYVIRRAIRDMYGHDPASETELFVLGS